MFVPLSVEPRRIRQRDVTEQPSEAAVDALARARQHRCQRREDDEGDDHDHVLDDEPQRQD